MQQCLTTQQQPSPGCAGAETSSLPIIDERGAMIAQAEIQEIQARLFANLRSARA